MTKKNILKDLNAQDVKARYQNTMFFVNSCYDIIAGMVIKASSKQSFYIDNGKVVLVDVIPSDIFNIIKW